MNKIEISEFLTETQDAEPRWVVRMFNSEDHLLRTRVVGSEEEANNTKIEWAKLTNV